MNKFITLEQIRAAQDKIRSRRGRAANRIAEIESGHAQRMIDYAAGIISGEELDALASELPKLREIANEDNTDTLEYFARLERQELERQRLERNRQEVLEQRRAWAAKDNAALASTVAPNLPQVEELAHTRPGDFPGPVWHRFTNHRLDFAALPAGDVTYGEFASLAQFDPEL